MESSQEIAFQIYYEDTITPLNFSESQTINEFKEFVSLCLECNMADIVLFVESYGRIDSPDILELPLSLIELKPKSQYTYKLFCINTTKIEKLIINDTYCVNKIFSIDKKSLNSPLSQYGLRLKGKENKIICIPCAKICFPDIFCFTPPEQLVKENFICECCKDKDNKCKFDSCEITYTINQEKEELVQDIMKKLKQTLEERNDSRKKEIEKEKLEEIKQKTLLRDFHFEQSIGGDMQLISNYKSPELQKRIKEIVPQRKENSTSKEYVKELLNWYKRKFFTWCNKPKCPLCDSDKDVENIGSVKSDESERKFQAYRTEVYNCKNHEGGLEVRFPRYNAPIKLLDTKTGRCGEWANLFGAILYACGFKTRLVSNYEDHVWNEFYNEEEKRWIHVDSCEEAYDTPLVYEQGWGRVMTFIVASSEEEIVDVTPRYVKDWCVIKERRSEVMENNLKAVIRNWNNNLANKLNEEEKKKLEERRKYENEELGNKTNNCIIKEEEKMPRQSGSLQWRKDRGEI